MMNKLHRLEHVRHSFDNLKVVISIKESWPYHLSERQMENNLWNAASTPQKKIIFAPIYQNRQKSMLCVWWNQSGIV